MSTVSDPSVICLKHNLTGTDTWLLRDQTCALPVMRTLVCRHQHTQITNTQHNRHCSVFSQAAGLCDQFHTTARIKFSAWLIYFSSLIGCNPYLMAIWKFTSTWMKKNMSHLFWSCLLQSYFKLSHMLLNLTTLRQKTHKHIQTHKPNTSSCGSSLV